MSTRPTDCTPAQAVTSLLAFLFVGLIVVTIAKALAPGRDAGVGISLLVGAVAQIVAWFGSRFVGLDRYGQPWLFFLSIGAAVALLHIYRESGLEAALARRRVAVTSNPDAGEIDCRPLQVTSVWMRPALVPTWAAVGALMLGATGFVIGFFGPMQFAPGANQGPMLGLFITGPGGLVLGAVAGGAVAIARPEWPTKWRLRMLNATNLAWGLFLLDFVADPWWRH